MKKIILLTFIALALTSVFISAERYENNYFKLAIIEADNQVTFTGEKVNDVHVRGYVCSSENCNSLGAALWNGNELTSQDDAIQLIYPTILQSHHGYAVYMYKAGYIPYEVNANLSGTDIAPIGPLDNFMTKMRSCSSNIFSYVNSYADSTMKVNLTVNSPIAHSGLLNVVPDVLKQYYSTKIDVNLTAYRNGSFYTSETKLVDVPYSENSSVSLQFSTLPGTYRIVTSVKAADTQCLSSTTDSHTQTVTIPEIYQPDTTPPNIVNNFHLVSKSATSLGWGWVNPSDFDFAYNKIYIDNINVANTSSSSYAIFGLLPNTKHTITVYTVDISGNINLNEVSDTQTTFHHNHTHNIIPELNIVSPQNATYTAESIIIILESNNSSETSFSIDNSTAEFYSAPFVRTFSFGSHTLFARAVSLTGDSVTRSVTFTIIPAVTPATEKKSASEKKIKKTVEEELPQVKSLRLALPAVEEEVEEIDLTAKQKKQPTSFSLLNVLLLAAILLLLIAVAVVVYAMR